MCRRPHPEVGLDLRNSCSRAWAPQLPTVQHPTPQPHVTGGRGEMAVPSGWPPTTVPLHPPPTLVAATHLGQGWGAGTCSERLGWWEVL